MVQPVNISKLVERERERERERYYTISYHKMDSFLSRSNPSGNNMARNRKEASRGAL